MITVILATLAAAATPSCRPIDGADALINDRAIRWIVVGELHGTAETPEAFADLVCLAAQSGRRIVVVLERPETEQVQIDAYLESDGSLRAQAELTQAAMWHMATQDGRSSKACLALIERLRIMAQAHMIAGVVAAQPNKPPPTDRTDYAAGYERDMAQIVETAGAQPGTLVLMLVGNIHAMTRAVGGFDAGPSYMPMAGLLPQRETRTLNATGNGGNAWNCTGSPMVCSAHPSYASGNNPPGIVLVTDPTSGYSGSFNLGVPTTASPPAAAPTAQTATN